MCNVGFLDCVLEQMKATSGYEHTHTHTHTHTHSTKCKGLPILRLFCISPVCPLLLISTALPQSLAASHLKLCFTLLGVSLPPASLPPSQATLYPTLCCKVQNTAHVSPVPAGYIQISASWESKTFCNLQK